MGPCASSGRRLWSLRGGCLWRGGRCGWRRRGRSCGSSWPGCVRRRGRRCRRRRGRAGEELGRDFVDAAFGFGPGERGAGDGGVAIFEDGEDPSKRARTLEDLGGVSARRVPASAAELAARTRSKMAARASAVLRSLASAAVKSCAALAVARRVGIVAAGKPPVTMRWWKVRRRSTALVDSARPSKVKFSWWPIGHGDEQEADRRGAIALEQQVAQGVEVALGLRHLLAFDEQEADVHPVPGEGLAGGGFGLRDLVLVVREHQVFAAGVEVEASPRNFIAMAEHSMCQPGRPAPSASPSDARRAFGGLPQGEVAGGVLVVLVDVDAGAVFDAVEVFLGELAVLGEARRCGSTSCRLRPGRRCPWRRGAR
jgi:hypothetical protein